MVRRPVVLGKVLTHAPAARSSALRGYWICDAPKVAVPAEGRGNGTGLLAGRSRDAPPLGGLLGATAPHLPHHRALNPYIKGPGGKVLRAFPGAPFLPAGFLRHDEDDGCLEGCDLPGNDPEGRCHRDFRRAGHPENLRGLICVPSLKAHGVDATASHKIVFAAELPDKDVVIANIRKLGAQDVLVTRVMDTETVKTYVPGQAVAAVNG